MFETLTDKLVAVFNRLGNKGRMSEQDVDAALKEVRIALLEADVNFQVAKDFISSVREKAVGNELLKGISPGHHVVKLVHDELVTLLGSANKALNPGTTPPSVLLLVGLQGSGKTTTAGKLALHLRRQGQRPLLVAADLRRPAAVEQLNSLGRQLDVLVYSEPLANPNDSTKVSLNGIKRAREINASWVIVDTSGRLHLDDQLMKELETLKTDLQPDEILLVLDSMTGQDAVNAAREFHDRLGLTGLVLSKLDGDARGGAALAVTHTTGVPIKFAGVGESAHELEPFHPDRMAARILGMGDVVTLVEKAQEQFDHTRAQDLERKLRKSQLDLDDFLSQLRQIQRIGSLTSIVGMLPKALRSHMPAADIDAAKIKHLEAIISSMTMLERRHPDNIRGSQRRRIASGSGVTVAEVNQLLGQFKQMQKMMKQMASGKKGLPGFKHF